MSDGRRSALLIGAAVVVCDQATKQLGRSFGPTGRTTPITNSKWILGLAAPPWPVTLTLSAIATLLFIKLMRHWSVSWTWIGLLAGGVAGNWLDRLRTTGVQDWWHVGPIVLNIADIAIATALFGSMVSIRKPMVRPLPVQGGEL